MLLIHCWRRRSHACPEPWPVYHVRSFVFAVYTVSGTSYCSTPRPFGALEKLQMNTLVVPRSEPSRLAGLGSRSGHPASRANDTG